MGLVESLTVVTQSGKILEERAAVLTGVHFAEEDGTIFFEQALGSAKYFRLSSFNVALQKVGRTGCFDKLIQRHGRNLNSVVCGCGRNMTESAVR